MNLSEIFIRRPVATTLLSCGLSMAGLMGYFQLPVAALPQVDYPTIVVATVLPGASADTMAATVTTPLERQFGQMPSLGQMTSVSSFASSQITLQFALDRNIDAAEQDVQAAINAAANLLPKALPAPPIYSKSNPADTPVLTLSVSSKVLPLSVVDDYADSILAQKLSQVPGVGLVTLGGGQKPAVRIQVDPEALAGANLTLEEVRLALAAANINAPKGSIDGPRQSYALATDDQLLSAKAYEPLILAYVNGAPVRLRDVADVVDGVENAQLAGWASGQRAIILNVQRQPGANIIAVTDRIRAMLPHLSQTAPQGIDLKVISDRTQTVRASVDDVQRTLLLTIALVVLVIWVFLRDIWATLIPGITVPLSLIGTFGIMYWAGYSLDNLSLMALTVSTGFVVDDAIVMIENIARYIEMGDSPFDAALKGAKQIGFTIISLTVSLIAVLIPLLFMQGIIGRLFREFAMTLACAIAVSAALSLTLTPMMCALLLKPTTKKRPGWFHNASEASFEALGGMYDAGLRWVLRRTRWTMLVQGLTLVATVVLALLIPKGFFPQQDTGLMIGVTQAAADVSFGRMLQLQKAVAEVVLQDPDVDEVASFIGSDGTNAAANMGRLTISLNDGASRRRSSSTIRKQLDQALQSIDGITVYLQAVQDLQTDSRLSRAQYQYTLESADATELQAVSHQVLEALGQLPQLKDVASDDASSALSGFLSIDRDTAARLGVTAQSIDDVLYDAFGQRIVSTIFTQLNQYRVILEVKPEFQQNPDALGQIYVASQSGPPVPLSAFTSFERRAAPLSVNHQGQFPAITYSFNLAPHAALGDGVEAIEAAIGALNLPNGVHGSFVGTAQAFREALASEPALIAAALLVVYIVLGVLYESYIHPITILSTLPSAGLGALAALMICGEEFNIIGLIGIVLLIGIVKKNAIMMVDFALEAQRETGAAPSEAIYQACLLRFRPIMMTTLAALLGALPLALGQGTGSELRRPMGIAIVGGLCVSQLLTLFTTPVVYLYMSRLGRSWGARRHDAPGANARGAQSPS